MVKTLLSTVTKSINRSFTCCLLLLVSKNTKHFLYDDQTNPFSSEFTLTVELHGEKIFFSLKIKSKILDEKDFLNDFFSNKNIRFDFSIE